MAATTPITASSKKHSELADLARQMGWELPINDLWDKESVDVDEEETADDEEIIQADKEDIDEVCEATSETSENVHGGHEATKDIKGSPNAANGGVEEKQQNSSDGHEASKKEEADGSNNEETMKRFMDRIVSLPVGDELPQACRKVARLEKGRLEDTRTSKWDMKLINKYVLRGEEWKIPTAKKKTSSARQAAFFLDLSGSFEKIAPVVKACIKVMSQEGFRITVYDCANGFRSDRQGSLTAWGSDYYNSYLRLLRICKNTTARVDKNFIHPCIKDAVKIAEKADFSIIFSDYDGFSTFSEVSYKCKDEKIPYLFDFELRYDDPSEHDWNYDPYYDYKDSSRWWSFRDYAEDLEERLYGRYDEDDYED